MVSVNTAGQMEKRFTSQLPEIELVVSSVEGSSAHGTKGRPNDISEHIPAALRNGVCRPTDFCSARLPSGGMVAIIDGDSLTLINEGAAEEIRLSGMHFPKTSWDLGKRAKGLASGIVFGRFVEVKTATVGRYDRRVTPVYSVMRYVNPDPTSGNV